MSGPVDPVALAGELIRIPSSDPPGGELGVAESVAAALAASGIEVELDEFRPGRANVLGRIRGAGRRPALVFSAHMDTVPIGDQPWSFPPYAGDVVGGRLRGRGASDMKSALAAFVAAAAEIQAGPTLAGDLILAFTAGESANAIGARRMAEQGLQGEIGAFLCGEPSSLDLVIAEPAVLWLRAEATGRVGHVSGAGGVNAIDVMTRCLAGLDASLIAAPAHPHLAPPTLSVGRIQGGAAVNVTPDRCVAEIDLRFGPGITPEAARAALEAAAPDGVAFSVIDFKPAVTRPPEDPLVRLAGEVVEAARGAPPALRGVAYYSDAAILLDGLDVPFVILGPGELGQSGAPDETAPAEDIRLAATLYRQIAERWLT